MEKGPLGSWPEVERRRDCERRVVPDRRSGEDRRCGIERRVLERRQESQTAETGVPFSDRRSVTRRERVGDRRVTVRRSGLDRRLVPMYR